MSAFFFFFYLSSRVRIACFLKSASRNLQKQVLIFRFMPSQFATHGDAASRTQTNRPRTMSTIHGQPERVAGAVRTSAEDRATLPGAEAEAPTDRERRRGSPKPSHEWKNRNRAEDPKGRPRRADPRRNADRMQKPPPEP